jgi:hypothetical protein
LLRGQGGRLLRLLAIVLRLRLLLAIVLRLRRLLRSRLLRLLQLLRSRLLRLRGLLRLGRLLCLLLTIPRLLRLAWSLLWIVTRLASRRLLSIRLLRLAIGGLRRRIHVTRRCLACSGIRLLSLLGLLRRTVGHLRLRAVRRLLRCVLGLLRATIGLTSGRLLWVIT